MLSRRSLIIQLLTTALVGGLATRVPWAVAADKTVKIGINLPFTGADAHDAELIKDGALLAIDEANAQGGVGGYRIEVLLLDDGTATAGQYDPAQAATNARKMVAEKKRRRGHRSADERFRQSDVADFEPRRTRDHHSELDQPRYHRPEICRAIPPKRQADLFRTKTTDAFQGPNMANYYADGLKVKSVKRAL